METKNRSVWQQIVSFFVDLMESVRVGVSGAEPGSITTAEEYGVIIDTAIHRYLGAYMYPLIKGLLMWLTISAILFVVGMVLIFINVFLFYLLYVPLVLIEISVNAVNILTYFKNMKKTRMILLDTCYQIDGTILEMRKNDGSEVEIDTLEQVKKRIMRNNLITEKGLDRYKNKQLKLMETPEIKQIRTVFGFEGNEAVERRVQQKILEYHIPLIEDYMDFSFDSFDDGFSAPKSEDVPSR
jgi:hypothetical protein